MLYGYSRNTGHGWRRPSYGWTPSFTPRRRKYRRKRRVTRRPRPYREPEVTLVEYLLRYPSLSSPRTDEKIILDPARNLGDLIAKLLGACVPFLFVYWQATLALGIAVLAINYFLHRTRGVEKQISTACEQVGRVYRINRKISVNPPPTPEALEAAWAATRGGRRGDPDILAARLRLGAMLSDLEPSVDQTYIRDEDGTIIGRQPGLRGWVKIYVPELLPHYKTLMAYKALADKLRIAMEISEPDTLDGFLEFNPTRGEISVDVAPVSQAPETGTIGDGSTNAGEAPNKIRDGNTNAGEESNAIRDGKGKARGARLRARFRTPAATRAENVREAYLALFPEEFPRTMAAVEEAVRARLGQTWMHRGARRPLLSQGRSSGQTVA